MSPEYIPWGTLQMKCPGIRKTRQKLSIAWCLHDISKKISSIRDKNPSVEGVGNPFISLKTTPHFYFKPSIFQDLKNIILRSPAICFIPRNEFHNPSAYMENVSCPTHDKFKSLSCDQKRVTNVWTILTCLSQGHAICFQKRSYYQEQSQKSCCKHDKKGGF